MFENLLPIYFTGTLSIIGICQWLKNTPFGDKIKKYMPYISLVLSMIFGWLAARDLDTYSWWTVISCGLCILAITQLGYQAIIKGIGDMISNKFGNKEVTNA